MLVCIILIIGQANAHQRRERIMRTTIAPQEVYYQAMDKAADEGFVRDILDVVDEVMPQQATEQDYDAVYIYVNTATMRARGVI